MTLSRSLSSSEVLAALSRELLHAVERASECSLSWWDEAGDQLVDVAAHREIGTRPTGEVYAPLSLYPRTRTMLERGDGYIEYRITDPKLAHADREVLEWWKWRSVVEMPLVVEGCSLGLIEVADHRSARSWSRRDVSFCQTICTQAALAVRNAQLYEDLKAQVDRDPLTGLLNHRAFYERLEQELARAGRTGDPVAVLVLDLDDFKRINDTRGHLAGDDALRALAGVLLAACRSQDVAARLGGDEFAMILPGAGGDAHATAERLLAEVDAATGLRLSIGGAVAEGPRAHSIRTMSRADSSLLQAKQAGKHTFRLAA